MATTYEAIATVEVGSGGAATIEFTSIPATYTDLVVKLSLRKSDSNTLSWSNMTFNSSSSGYSAKRLYGNGSAAASDTNPDVGTSSLYIGSSNSATSTSNTFSNFEVYIPNYTSSNNKSISIDSVQEDNATSAYQFLVAGLWSNSAAISRIDIAGFANYVEYSTATLYGIKNS